MRRLASWAAVLAVLAGCGSEKVSGPPPAAPTRMTLSSPAFGGGAAIPRRFTCDGANASPPLRWSRPPAGARSLALLMEDPDAPGGTFVHWTAYGLAARAGGLEAGQRAPREGTNSFGDRGYGGPCPPGGQTHRYVFTVYALRSRLPLEPGAKPADVRAAIAKSALARGQLTGRYGR